MLDNDWRKTNKLFHKRCFRVVEEGNHWSIAINAEEDLCYAVKVVLTFEFVDEILTGDYYNESY